MNLKKLLILDLDGVLINSKSNMRRSLKLTAKSLNINLSFKQYEKHLGLPFEKIMEKMKITSRVKDIKKIYEKFSLKEINKISISKKKITDLKKLKKDFYITVFTSKSRVRTNKILKKFKLFDFTISADDVHKGKPNPEGLVKILDKFNFKKKMPFL
jgi:HAD superfamily hydrolase (TIGR01549 family)